MKEVEIAQRNTHSTVGIFVGLTGYILLTYILREKITMAGLVFATAIAAVGSVIPDLFEPTKSIWHRKFYHSKRIAKIILFIILAVFVIPIKPLITKILILVGLLGYESHLLLDSRTKKGLPKN